MVNTLERGSVRVHKPKKIVRTLPAFCSFSARSAAVHTMSGPDKETRLHQSKRTRLLSADISDPPAAAIRQSQPLPLSAPVSIAAVTGPSPVADGIKPIVGEQKRRVVSNVAHKVGTTERRLTSRLSSQARDPSVSTGEKVSRVRNEQVRSSVKELEPWVPGIPEQSHVVLETIVTVGDTASSVFDNTCVASGRSFEDVSTARDASTRQLSTTSIGKSSGNERKASTTATPKRSRNSRTAKDPRHYSRSKRSTVTLKTDDGTSTQSSGRRPGTLVQNEVPESRAPDPLLDATTAAAAKATEMSCAVTLPSDGEETYRWNSSLEVEQGDPNLLSATSKSKGTKSKSIDPPTELSFSASSGMPREDQYKKCIGDAVTTFFATPISEDFRREMEDISARVGKNDTAADADVALWTVCDREAVKTSAVTSPSATHVSGSSHGNDEQDRSGNVVLIKRELCLYPLCVLLSLAIMGVTLIFVLPTQPATGRRVLEYMLNRTSLNPPGTAQPRDNPFCSTATCGQDAAFLDNLLSWNVDPCDNFYQFVCSRWTNQPTSEGILSKTSIDDDYTEHFEARMYTVLQNLTKGNVLLQPLRSLFRECVSTEYLESAGWDPLLELLALTSLEGFPFTPPVRSSASVWKIAAKVLKMTGAAVLLTIDVVPHPKSGDRDIIALGVPDTMADIYDGNINEVIQTYYSIVYTAVRALRKEFIPPLHTIQIVDFGYELERLFIEKRGKGDPSAQSLSNNPELRAFASEIFDGVTPPAYTGTSSDVLLKSPEFIMSLLELVKKTEPHIVMNLLAVRMMVRVSAFTPLTDLTEVYSSLLYHKPKTSVQRWKLCVRAVERTVPPLFLLAALLDVRIQSVTSDLLRAVRAIVEEIVRSLDGAVFLDDAGKAAAKKVVATTQYRVLGPDWVGEKNVVEEYFTTVPKVVRGQGLMSYAVLHQHTFSARLARGSGSRWTSSLFQTDCWSQRRPRAIYVPALFFNVSLRAIAQESKALQLPRAGFRLARCIFRMLFQEAGSWMSENSRTKLEATLRCLKDQYRSDLAPQMTRFENNVAVQPALLHFMEVMRTLGNRTSLRLPRNGDLGPEQLFFVYLMLQSCSGLATGNLTTAEDYGLVQNVQLRNEPAFQKAFRCSGQSYMNPPQKCHLWNSS